MFPPPALQSCASVVSEAKWLLCAGGLKRRNHWDLRLADR